MNVRRDDEEVVEDDCVYPRKREEDGSTSTHIQTMGRRRNGTGDGTYRCRRCLVCRRPCASTSAARCARCSPHVGAQPRSVRVAGSNAIGRTIGSVREPATADTGGIVPRAARSRPAPLAIQAPMPIAVPRRRPADIIAVHGVPVVGIGIMHRTGMIHLRRHRGRGWWWWRRAHRRSTGLV